MLMIVIKKPKQVTIVNAVPFCSADVRCATKVENIGESATTIQPHKTRKPVNAITGKEKITGDDMQQQAEHNKAIKAVRFTPAFSEIYPLAIHAIDPAAITKKEMREIFIAV